jgi:hypothetical protein
VDRSTATSFVAECFWPGVSDDDLRALDERAGASVAALTAEGEAVGYLGSILVRDDEVVLCLFEGSAAAVRRAAERAAIPFERILEATDSARLAHPDGGRRRPRPTRSDPGRDQR